MADNDAVKKPYLIETFTDEQIEEIEKCSKDVLYFIEKYVKIKHPKKGSVPFVPFEYQKEMIKVFSDNRFAISMAGRQQGKSVSFETIISFDCEKRKIGSLIPYKAKDRVINFLERLLFKLAKRLEIP